MPLLTDSRDLPVTVLTTSATLLPCFYCTSSSTVVEAKRCGPALLGVCNAFVGIIDWRWRVIIIIPAPDFPAYFGCECEYEC
jgi:hypothetical protein